MGKKKVILLQVQRIWAHDRSVSKEGVTSRGAPRLAQDRIAGLPFPCVQEMSAAASGDVQPSVMAADATSPMEVCNVDVQVSCRWRMGS